MSKTIWSPTSWSARTVLKEGVCLLASFKKMIGKHMVPLLHEIFWCFIQIKFSHKCAWQVLLDVLSLITWFLVHVCVFV